MTDQITEEQFKMTGHCPFFKSEPFIEAANILVGADEPLLALKVLESLPGFYRDNIPMDVHELKNKIKRHLYTPSRYANVVYDAKVGADNAYTVVKGTLRGQLIENDVKALNEKGETPKIVDLGPGEYWLPIGLKQLGHKFKYGEVSLCASERAYAKPLIEGEWFDCEKESGDIFVACEIVEHMHFEDDLRVEMERTAPNAKIIHVSTPKYTFDTRPEALDWEKKNGLGHLRTYTPKEFQALMVRLFPEFKFNIYDSQIMHARGERV